MGRRYESRAGGIPPADRERQPATGGGVRRFTLRRFDDRIEANAELKVAFRRSRLRLQTLALLFAACTSTALAGEPCPYVSTSGDFAICEFRVAEFWSGWELVTVLGAVPLGQFGVEVAEFDALKSNHSSRVQDEMKVVGGSLIIRRVGRRNDLAIRCDGSSSATMLLHGSGYGSKYFYSSVGGFQIVAERSDEVTKAALLNLHAVCRLTESAWGDLWNVVDFVRDLWEPVCLGRTERPCLSKEELKKPAWRLLLSFLATTAK